MANSHALPDHITQRARTEFPGVKLLALGQTLYWDEPMKAVLRLLLDKHYPEAVLIAGIHDADYFSRIPAPMSSTDGWMRLPHNDGTTRDLWVATGEISCLFGSETIPSRDALVEHGVQVDKAGRDFPGGRTAFLDAVTEAWGWRGLAHKDGSEEIACCIPLADVLPAFCGLLEWGFRCSLDSLAEPTLSRARAVADELLAQVREYATSHADASITDMYRDFLPRFYERLMRRSAVNLETAKTTELFRFNTSTAYLPRFDLVRAFLDPETSAACQEAYDASVEGSDIYTLDRFCEGAIPFDLVIPGVGRGTVCLRDGEVIVDTPQHIHMAVDRPVTTLDALAESVERHVGPDVALVGKAVTLILMASREFIFVLNEQASAYIWRCEKMAGLMKERGVSMPFYPILRLDYGAWDAVGASGVTFSLPEHLVSAFGRAQVTAEDFARSWRRVVADQEDLLRQIASLSSTDDLLVFLSQRLGEPWPSKTQQYLNAYLAVRELSERTEPMKQESIRLRDLSHQLKQEAQRLEVEKGRHFRREIKPLRESLWELERHGITGGDEVERIRASVQTGEDERVRLEREIERLHEEGIQARDEHLDTRKAVASLEKSREAAGARDLLKSIEQEAELAKLYLVRDAILVSKGLVYTNHRPSAWWLMMVDPEMKWFDRIVEITKLRFEEIDATGAPVSSPASGGAGGDTGAPGGLT